MDWPTADVLGDNERLWKEETKSWGAETWPRNTWPSQKQDQSWEWTILIPLPSFAWNANMVARWTQDQRVFWAEAHFTSACNSVFWFKQSFPFGRVKRSFCSVYPSDWHAFPSWSGQRQPSLGGGVGAWGLNLPFHSERETKRNQIWATGYGKLMAKHY